MEIRNATVFVIARLTFREASRRWVLWAAGLLGLVFLVVYALGFHAISQETLENPTDAVVVKEVFGFLLMAGLYVVNFLTAIMTVLTSLDTLSGEISSGTVHTMVSKPLRRWEIVLGKWLGFTLMMSIYLLLMGGGVMLIVYLISGYAAPHAMAGLGYMILGMLLLLSLSLVGGTTLSTLANGVMVFGLYGIAFIGGWIEQFGSLMKNNTAIEIGIISSLLMPSEAVWKRAAFEMQSTLVRTFGGMSPFTSPSAPSLWMMFYALIYTIVMLLLAIRLFKKRDL